MRRKIAGLAEREKAESERMRVSRVANLNKGGTQTLVFSPVIINPRCALWRFISKNDSERIYRFLSAANVGKYPT